MSDNIGSQKLKSFAERRIRLEDERDALNEDIGSVNTEIKAEGYTLRAFNLAVKRLRMTPEKRQEAEQLDMDFGLYCEALMGSPDEE